MLLESDHWVSIVVWVSLDTFSTLIEIVENQADSESLFVETVLFGDIASSLEKLDSVLYGSQDCWLLLLVVDPSDLIDFWDDSFSFGH